MRLRFFGQLHNSFACISGNEPRTCRIKAEWDVEKVSKEKYIFLLGIEPQIVHHITNPTTICQVHTFLPNSTTARAGPWPPLQHASKLLGSLLCPSIR